MTIYGHKMTPRPPPVTNNNTPDKAGSIPQTNKPVT